MLLLISFYALLRPCELTALKVSDFLDTTETGCSRVLFNKLTVVKSRARGARMQSVRLDIPFVDFLRKNFRAMHPQEKLWCFSTSLFRTRLQTALQAIAGDAAVCVPSSLRPGGAKY